MSFLGRVEAWCSNAVERSFALAFPSALEPVQIARKLVAAFENFAPGDARRRFVVRLSPADYARLGPDRLYLERQWRDMLARLAAREGRAGAFDVAMQSASDVATGTVAIGNELPAPASGLALRVLKGMPPDVSIELRGRVVIGRDPSCDLVLADSRVSRRHVELEADDDIVQFRDLESANGTLLNGRRAGTGIVRAGDVLRLGDSELGVETQFHAGAV